MERVGFKEARRIMETEVLGPDSSNWFESECVYNPAAAVLNDEICLLYRAEDRYGDYISRIGLAKSRDGLNFSKHSGNPVIGIDGPYYRTEMRGCEDPRIVKVGESYFLTYTAFDGSGINLCGALSGDMEKWNKLGCLIAGVKSGALLDRKIGGYYYMYYGDTSISLARSTDLRSWEALSPPVLYPRPGLWDSALVEPGPPPIVTDKGILLIYNSSDGRRYSVGQALFQLDKPWLLIGRDDEPLIVPELPWERYGKVNNVVFAEGLVNWAERWLLYYGAADKCIGLAECRLS